MAVKKYRQGTHLKIMNGNVVDNLRMMSECVREIEICNGDVVVVVDSKKYPDSYRFRHKKSGILLDDVGYIDRYVEETSNFKPVSPKIDSWKDEVNKNG